MAVVELQTDNEFARVYEFMSFNRRGVESSEDYRGSFWISVSRTVLLTAWPDDE